MPGLYRLDRIHTFIFCILAAAISYHLGTPLLISMRRTYDFVMRIPGALPPPPPTPSTASFRHSYLCEATQRCTIRIPMRRCTVGRRFEQGLESGTAGSSMSCLSFTTRLWPRRKRIPPMRASAPGGLLSLMALPANLFASTSDLLPSQPSN